MRRRKGDERGAEKGGDEAFERAAEEAAEGRVPRDADAACERDAAKRKTGEERRDDVPLLLLLRRCFFLNGDKLSPAFVQKAEPSVRQRLKPIMKAQAEQTEPESDPECERGLPFRKEDGDHCADAEGDKEQSRRQEEHGGEQTCCDRPEIPRSHCVPPPSARFFDRSRAAAGPDRALVFAEHLRFM